MKTSLFVFALLLAGCCETQYVAKPITINMPERPTLKSVDDSAPDGEVVRVTEDNSIILSGYATSLENLLKSINNQ